MTEETDSVNTSTVLDCSEDAQKCSVNIFYNSTQKDCECNDENSLIEDISHGTDLDVLHEYGTKTKKKVSFSDQVLIYELKNDYKCEKCCETYKDYLTLRRHIQRKHKKQKHYICYYCAKKFTRRDLFKVHIKLHCDVCSLLLPNRCQYLKHKENVCRITGNQDVVAMGLEQRWYGHLNTCDVCELCKKRFSSKCALKYHISNDHLNENAINLKVDYESNVDMYQCPYCNESSIYQDKIEKHLGLLSNSNENMVANEHLCDQCCEKFNTEKDLLNHKWSHYINLQNDKSSVETIDTPSMKNFPVHLQNKTIDVKNGVPDQFNPRVLLERLNINLYKIGNDLKGKFGHDKSRTAADILIEDSSLNASDFCRNFTHSKDTDNQCNICQKYYYSNYNLYRHMKTHIKEKCIFCGMEFITRNKLNEHKCNKIPEIPAADERTVVNIDDLNKSSSQSKVCSETTLTAPIENEPIIIDVRSLNASYNILKKIEAIKIKKFNIINEVPHFFQPKVLVERMDFDSLFSDKSAIKDFDNVIDVDAIDDTVRPSAQKNMVNNSNNQSYIETPNLLGNDNNYFNIPNNTNDPLHMDKNICNNNTEGDKTLKPHVGSIRVIKNTTANFIDTMDYQDVYLKSVRQWDHVNECLLPGNHDNNSLNRLKNASEIQTHKLKHVVINEQSTPKSHTIYNGESHDITDDIPVTILKKITATSTCNEIQNPNAPSAPNSLLNERQKRLPGPPRLINHELNDSPSLRPPQGNGQKQSNGQVMPGEVFHLQPASMLILTDSNEVQLQPGYLVRLNNQNVTSNDTQNIQAIAVPTLNHGQDEVITNVDASQNSNQIPHVPNEQFESLPKDNETGNIDSTILQDVLNKGDKTIDPLHINSQDVTSVNAEPISTVQMNNDQRMLIDSRPETSKNKTSNLIFHNIRPKLVPNRQDNPNTSTASVLSGMTRTDKVNENSSKESQGCENNSPSTYEENIASVITMPYDCKICGRYFHSKSSLTLHLRKTHKLASNYAPLIFVCNVCDEAFVKCYSLQRHRCSKSPWHNRTGAQCRYNNAPIESQNPLNNIMSHTIIDLTDSQITPNDYVPNDLQLLNSNTTMQNLNSVDVEVPVLGSSTETEFRNISTPTNSQIPAVSMSTYEFENYKLVLTEVPIEF